MEENESHRDWARKEFEHAELGDSRRTSRLVMIAASAAQRPNGKMLEIFQTSAERQGAYGFINNAENKVSKICQASYQATLERSKSCSIVYCPIDGSSLSLTDRANVKGFGNVGSTASNGCGLKVITAYGMDQDGTPIGVVNQQYWARKSGKERKDRAKRQASEKETQYWLNAIQKTGTLFGEESSKLWFLVDREGDSQHILTELSSVKNANFTVRSSSDRRLADGESHTHMLAKLKEQKPLGTYELVIPRNHKRAGRKANMVVRTCNMTIRFMDPITRQQNDMNLNVVEAFEEAPAGTKIEDKIMWRLLTNSPVESFGDAMFIVEGYTYRWGIEDFHKTWKSSACNVENSQLRSFDNMVRFASIMATVASRVERLKIRSRKEPNIPADTEFKPAEIRAIILLKRANKKRTETIPDSMPTLAQATLWVAELGGYTGKSSGGPPGSLTIRRGMEYIAPVALLIEKNEM